MCSGVKFTQTMTMAPGWKKVPYLTSWSYLPNHAYNVIPALGFNEIEIRSLKIIYSRILAYL